jgi:hypothetical protein
MSTPNRRSTTSITDAVYPRRGKAPRKPAAPKRDVNPRHGFSLASQLDPATLWKLERLASKGKRKGAK